MGADGAVLLATARETLARGVLGERHRPDLARCEPSLRRNAATFVTLRAGARLRGCRGILEPVRPLLEDVAYNTWLTAFEDSRFPPVEAAELGALTIEISLLSPLRRVPAETREALFEALLPGETGLILAEGGLRATFLPKEWQSLPEPHSFVDALLRKAGLPTHGWSTGRQAWIYTTESLAGPAMTE